MAKAQFKDLEKIIKCANKYHIYRLRRGNEERVDLYMPFKLSKPDSKLPRLNITFKDEEDIRNGDKVYIKATMPEREDEILDGICEKPNGKFASIKLECLF